MGKSMVQILKGVFVFLPMLAGAALMGYGLWEDTAGPGGGFPALLLVMLGMIPVLLCCVYQYYQGRALSLMLCGVLVLAAGAVQSWFLQDVLEPLPREELEEVSGSFASIGVIPIYRGPDDYRIRLQQDDIMYRGMGFLNFPAEKITERAQRGDEVDILYDQGRNYRVIYGFRLNGDDLLSYETSYRARKGNQGLSRYLLVLPVLIFLFCLLGAFRCRHRAPRRRAAYRYTGRRFWRR